MGPRLRGPFDRVIELSKSRLRAAKPALLMRRSTVTASGWVPSANWYSDDVRDVATADGVQNVSIYDVATSSDDAERHRRRWRHPVLHASTTSVVASVCEVVKIKVKNGARSHDNYRYLSKHDA